MILIPPALNDLRCFLSTLSKLGSYLLGFVELATVVLSLGRFNMKFCMVMQFMLGSVFIMFLILIGEASFLIDPRALLKI